MSNPLQKRSKFQVVSSCFSQVAALKTYQNQWRTNEQWANIVWSRYQDILSPLLDTNEEMDGKLLDTSLKKDKVMKNNLNNYNVGTNAVGIMCREYKPTMVINGKQKKVPVKCYILLPPYAGEPPLAPGQSWWQTLPPTRTRESSRNKRC